MNSIRTNFFLIWALITLAIVILGFAPTFYLRPLFGSTDYSTGSTELPIHLVIHGLSMTAWYVIFAIQTYLGKKRKIALHRTLGIAGIIVAAIVIASGYIVLVEFIPRNPVVEAVTNINVGNTMNFIVFASMITAGLYYRRTPDVHKRLMLFAGVVNIGPALTTNRMLGEYLHVIIPDAVPLTLLFKVLVVASLVWLDIKTKQRVQPVTLIGGSILIGAIFASQAIANSALGTAYYEFLS
jgi:hypothetical protein